MKTINPYLNFAGNTEEAFNFYKSVFGGEFTSLQRFRGTAEADKLPENEKDKIMHISLPIGKGNTLMATDALESMGKKIQTGKNFYLSVDADSKEEADKLFNDLSKDGIIELPMQDMFWGDYFGMFTDKFGIKWMINFNANQSE